MALVLSVIRESASGSFNLLLETQEDCPLCLSKRGNQVIVDYLDDIKASRGQIIQHSPSGDTEVTQSRSRSTPQEALCRDWLWFGAGGHWKEEAFYPSPSGSKRKSWWGESTEPVLGSWASGPQANGTLPGHYGPSLPPGLLAFTPRLVIAQLTWEPRDQAELLFPDLEGPGVGIGLAGKKWSSQAGPEERKDKDDLTSFSWGPVAACLVSPSCPPHPCDECGNCESWKWQGRRVDE